MKQFIGPNEVLGLMKEEFLTPSGREVVKVQYKGEHPPELMSRMAFDYLATDKPSDYNDLRDRKFRKMVPDIITLITEWDIKSIELKPLLGQIGDSLQDAMERAGNYLWTHDERTWVPGMSFMNERTLLEAERVLQSINKENGAKKDSTDGSGQPGA